VKRREFIRNCASFAAAALVIPSILRDMLKESAEALALHEAKVRYLSKLGCPFNVNVYHNGIRVVHPDCRDWGILVTAVEYKFSEFEDMDALEHALYEKSDA